MKRRPGDANLLYNLACGQALTGQTAAAEKTLLQLAALRASSDLDADTDFDAIRQSAGYRAASAKMKALRGDVVSSGAVVAFTIPEKGLVPEGVAYDPKTKSFFLSSIRKREVYRIDASGKATVFVAPRQGGLRSAAGIAVDPRSRSLWVASEAMPHMEGHVKDEPLQSAVFEFDADTGKFRRELKAPALEKPAAFDDVSVGPDGRLWVNDGFNGRIFTLAPGGSALEVFLETGEFRGTQGIAPTPDGKSILRLRLLGALSDRRRNEAHHPPRGPAERRSERHRRARALRRQPLRRPERARAQPRPARRPRRRRRHGDRG